MNKPTYNVVSFSGGKDSTAMLLMMLEHNMKIDCILFCDTGLEFPAMYDHIAKVEKKIGREITRIRSKYSFEYLMFDIPVNRRPDSPAILKYNSGYNGYGWPRASVRWCTNELKKTPINHFLQNLRKQYNVIEYVGLAADEQYRLTRKNNQKQNHIHPLIEWKMTEADCLKYCYDHGYDWNGLYEKFKRVSCWCCPMKSLEELRQLWKSYPDLWKKLDEWDKRNWMKFRANYSVCELESRFKFEEECINCGKPIKGKAFFEELKKRIYIV